MAGSDEFEFSDRISTILQDIYDGLKTVCLD